MLKKVIKETLYRLYEVRLARQIAREPVPKHVGLILDGNRRYGKQIGIVEAEQIYRLGAEKLDEVLDWCVALGIPAITLWVFSTDNFSRDAHELSGLLKATEAKLLQLVEHPQIHKHQVNVRAVGRLDLLPKSLVAAVRAAEEATKQYKDVQLTLAAAYGGREEITDAVQALLKDELASAHTPEQIVAAITPEAIGRYMYSAHLPDPDLIIRPSGEIRLSGFMLWQSVHSEFYFTDVFWPAFRRVDFYRAVRAYQQRNRRFGH